jgi:hypothetical protein
VGKDLIRFLFGARLGGGWSNLRSILSGNRNRRRKKNGLDRVSCVLWLIHVLARASTFMEK